MWPSDGNKKVDLTNDLSAATAKGTGEEGVWLAVLRGGEGDENDTFMHLAEDELRMVPRGRRPSPTVGAAFSEAKRSRGVAHSLPFERIQ